MVPAARLELARPFDRQILSLLCLPFHQAGTGETLTFLAIQIKRGFQTYVSSYEPTPIKNHPLTPYATAYIVMLK